MYQKKSEKNFLQKMSPHLTQLNVVMAHVGIILGKIICDSLLWQHILQRLKITTCMLGANWQLFRLERIVKCSYFILSTQNIKFY